MNRPILSICIPTYNRAVFLESTLLSIVDQIRFIETDDVEVVIVDNCSEDDTNDVVQKYVEIYGDKIRYYRNQENIKAANVEKVLSYGKGIFLKLNNDTLMHQENTLDAILSVIQESQSSEPVIFFSNGRLSMKTLVKCYDLNSFVEIVSYYSTWIACFGIWKTDFENIENFKSIESTLLVNDVLFRLISRKKMIIIDNAQLFTSITPHKKGGYNIFEVFVTNYITILEKYRKEKLLSRRTVFKEKSKLFLKFLIPWILIIKDQEKYAFGTKSFLPIILNKYWSHPILYLGGIYLLILLIKTSAIRTSNNIVSKYHHR